MTWIDYEEESLNGQGTIKNGTAEQMIIKNKGILFKSELLERIEQARLKKKNLDKLGLYPGCCYESNINANQFLKELTYLHTQYFVRHSLFYSSFVIDFKVDGVYCESGGRARKLPNLYRVTDQEIDDWFALLEKR